MYKQWEEGYGGLVNSPWWVGHSSVMLSKVMDSFTLPLTYLTQLKLTYSMYLCSVASVEGTNVQPRKPYLLVMKFLHAVYVLIQCGYFGSTPRNLHLSELSWKTTNNNNQCMVSSTTRPFAGPVQLFYTGILRCVQSGISQFSLV